MSVKQSWLIPFDWTRPPISMNDRLHWSKKSRLTKQIRKVTALQAAHIPPLQKCRVQLVWLVTDRRKRDADNPAPTYKAMCDGIVDAGIVTDDSPEFMEKTMTVISRVDKASGPAKLQLIIEEM